MTALEQVLTIAAAVGCGAMGGVFFAFSSFVMPALGRLPSEQGLAAMQHVNVAAVRPAFLTALIGTAACCAVLLVLAAGRWGQPGTGLLAVGAGLYLLGIIALTIGRHVPMNDALARLHPASPASTQPWRRYVRVWTAWNHVRAVSGLAAAVALVASLR